MSEHSKNILLRDVKGNDIATGIVPDEHDFPIGVRYDGTDYFRRQMEPTIEGMPILYTPGERLDYTIKFTPAGKGRAIRNLLDAAYRLDNADFEGVQDEARDLSELIGAAAAWGSAVREYKK